MVPLTPDPFLIDINGIQTDVTRRNLVMMFQALQQNATFTEYNRINETLTFKNRNRFNMFRTTQSTDHYLAELSVIKHCGQKSTIPFLNS